MKKILVFPLLLSVSLSACAPAADPVRKVETSPNSCSDPVVLVDSLSTFWKIVKHPSKHVIYGAPGGGGNNLLSQLKPSDLAVTFNPRGNGELITVIHSEGDWSLRRSGWLLLKGTLYPIDTDAANALKLLYKGFPASVANQAGITSDLMSSETFGIGGYLTYNQGEESKYDAFISEATNLCNKPTVWG